MMRVFRKRRSPVLAMILSLLFGFQVATGNADPPYGAVWQSVATVKINSSLDNQTQRVKLWIPPKLEEQSEAVLSAAERAIPKSSSPAPLLVYLHSWSGDYKQRNLGWFQQAVQRDWIYMQPDFRGPNQRPEACGSALARQDVLDAIAWVRDRWLVDDQRIYLAGASGGGHMAMLMAGHHPDRFSAVSAWVGISDLAQWYRFRVGVSPQDKYAAMIVASLQGVPGSSAQVDADYQERSPLYQLADTGDLPIDLAAGIWDGKRGSVPIWHTLAAFNALARQHGVAGVDPGTMRMLQEREPPPQQPANSPGISESDTEPSTRDDPRGRYPREIHLRQYAGPVRVTIFEGGHESLPETACQWLARQKRTATGWTAPQ